MNRFIPRSTAFLLMLAALNVAAGPMKYRTPFRMTSSVHGYALRTSSSSHGLSDGVLETKDSAAHWTALPPQTGRMAALLPDGSPAWFRIPPDVCAGGLETVEEERRPLWFFLDSSHAWVATCADARGAQEARSIFRTVDGGINWTQVSATSLEDAPGLLPATGHKSGIYFVDPSNGWVFGSNSAGTVDLFETGDGGKSWKRQELATPKNAWVGFRQQPDTLRIFAGRDGLLSLDVQLNTEEPTPTLYSTIDGGKHWKPLGDAPGGHLSFPDARHGFAAWGERLWSTKDGGRHWTRVSVGLGKIDELEFISADLGWAWTCGATFDPRCQLIATKDGGKRWFVEDPQETDDPE